MRCTTPVPPPKVSTVTAWRTVCYCLSRTVCAGREYSGRGGYRVYTQCFLVPENLLQRFSHHPFRVMEALVVSGRASVLTPIPDQLAPAPDRRARCAVKTAEVERLCQTLGPEKLASLVCAALKTDVLGVSAPVPPQRLFGVLLDLLPLRTAPQFLADHRSESVATPPVPPGRAARRSGRAAASHAPGAPHGARSACGPAGQVCGAQRLAVADLRTPAESTIHDPGGRDPGHGGHHRDRHRSAGRTGAGEDRQDTPARST